MVVPIFTAPLQCAESLHLGTLISLLHTDVIHRLRKSCGIKSKHLLLWNLTGKQAEKAALSLHLGLSEEGRREAVSELIRRNLEEIYSWNIEINTIHRDDQLDTIEAEKILNLLRDQGRLIQNDTGWNLVVKKEQILQTILELPVIPSVRNKLKQCMQSYPALYNLHKERVYAKKLQDMGIFL